MCIVGVFCFFKQNTAYEWRISDWSSDVCSSDLLEDVRVGERLRVRPGEKMPVDGVVHDGSSHVNEALLSGESLPLRKQAGDRVIGGSVNGSGALLIEARHVGSDTLLGQIVDRKSVV